MAKSFDLLKFKPVFKDYDEHRSQRCEYLDVITHTNELEQLRENIYYKQTTEGLETHYGDIFDDINKITQNLTCTRNKQEGIHALKQKVSELDLSPPYLKEKVFDFNSKDSCVYLKQVQRVRSHYAFILAKARLQVAIKRYLRTF
ncbi:MAG: hypothetical protein P1U39_00550 [Legionellaceae bacterium]|nr:hypothetical protein [Legionellaceae bacterium]